MADSPWHGSLFAGSITDPQRRISDADYITLTGFSAAYLWPLNRPGTAAGSGGGGVIGIPGNSVQYYLQVGPGLGMGGVGRVDDELEIHPYFYTDGALGAIIPVSRNRAGRSLFSGASFYTELGGLLAWFPTLSEMHFVVGPHITFGFNLFSGSDIPAVDY
ncbi:MAG: hypothetical protein R3281_04255 [Balneolaceae bacterium]|nr:hypothetical protein [Balneolaceae bacterium]